MRGTAMLGVWVVLAGSWFCQAEAIRVASLPRAAFDWIATPSQLSDYFAENNALPHFTKMDVDDDGAVTLRDRIHVQLNLPVTTEFPTEYTHDLFLINKPGASFVLMGADESDLIMPQFLDVIGAYDIQGHLLGVSYWHKELWYGRLDNNATLGFTLHDKFPHLHASDIAFLRINSTQRREGLTLINGETLPGLREAHSPARFPFIVGTRLWSTEIFLANLVAEGGRYLNFINLPEQVLDGRANPWQYTAPDLRGANTGAWIDFDQYFNKAGQPGGVLPDGSESARGLSEKRKLSGTTPIESLLSATLVRHIDGRMAVLPQQRALHEFLLQDVRNLESEGYQSVLTLVNDTDLDSDVILHAFRADGFDLGSFSVLVPAHGRIEQNIADLGVPTIAKYVTARSSQPVSGFNARVSADGMVFVPPQPLNNWTYIGTVNSSLYWKTLTFVDADVRLTHLDDTIGAKGQYAKLTIKSEIPWDNFPRVEFLRENSELIGRLSTHVTAQLQKVVDLEQLLTENGLGEFVGEVASIKVYPRTNPNDQSQNTPLNMLLETGAVERTATGVKYGDSAVRALMNTGQFDLKLFIGNETAGLENENIDGLVGDRYKTCIDLTSIAGKIEFVQVKLYDQYWNDTGITIGGYSETDARKWQFTIHTVNTYTFSPGETSPKGGYRVGVRIITNNIDSQNVYDIRTETIFKVKY